MARKPHACLVVFWGAVLSCCFLGSATTDDVLTTPQSTPALTTQSPTTQRLTGTTTTPTTTAVQTAHTTQATTFESTPTVRATTSLTQRNASTTPSAETPTDPSSGPALPSEAPAGPEETPGEPRTEAELCQEDSRRVLTICLIVIGALVFLCVCLLLAVAVLATKLSYSRRRQPSKRLPRTNGDFLSTNSLWPAGLETLQRISGESTGTAPYRQSLRSENTAAGPGKPGADAGKKLAGEISERQAQKEMLPKVASIKRPGSATLNTDI